MNTDGINNTYIGSNAHGTASLINATAIGADAVVGQSNSLVLGVFNTKVGIGTIAPNAKLQVTFGDVYVETQGTGIILRATTGANCFRVTVDNVGTLLTAPVACP